MKDRSRYRIVALLTAILICLFVIEIAHAKEKIINICSLVSAEQLAGIYKKELFPTKQRRGCFWSEDPGMMAYFQIGYQKTEKDLRQYFYKELPSHVKLEEIKDLGDGGLMAVTGDYLEVIVIRKKNLVLKSTVNFLDIKPGSKQHKQLWDIYRTILNKL